MNIRSRPEGQLTISRSELESYLEVPSVTLIPLHSAYSVTVKHGREIKNGKRPLDNGWRTIRYNSRDVLKRCLAENLIVGVRLTDTMLVIDVDPRNGGLESFPKLCKLFGIVPSLYPCVVTGSGGFHYYMKKPLGTKVIDTLKEFPGVEFKSAGRQVVAAGSIHPDTLQHYTWEFGGKPLSEWVQ